MAALPLALLRRGSSLPALYASPLSRHTPLCRMVATAGDHAATEGYVARNRKMNRPLSPSLAILARHPEPVWILSFLHRATGSVLTPGVSVAAIAYLASRTPFPETIKALEGVSEAHPVLWTTCKFMMAFPLMYHMVNGIRHLTWDTGRGFDMKFVVRAGFTVLTVSVIGALGLAFYTPAK